MDNKIQQKEDGNKGMFFIENEEGIVAELTYTNEDNGVMTLDHTEVNPGMRGNGLASKLVKHSVEYARENDLLIDPLCEYAAIQFEKHQEYQDVKAETS